MTRSRKLLALSAAVASVGVGSAARAADQPTNEQLMQQIQALQGKVEQLEAKQNAGPSTAAVDATVDSVLRDADERSKLLDTEGFTAGYNKGKFVLQDADGNFVLHPWLQLQIRHSTNYRSDGKHGGADSDVENGLELRRVKLGFDGNLFSPDLTYLFQWNTAAGALTLEEAWAKYFFTNDWAVRGGQITNPAIHEQVVSSKRQLAVERSLTNQIVTGVNQAYTQAVTLIYDNKSSPIFAEFGYEDGFNSQNTDFTDVNAGGTADWGATGRVNYFIFGPHGQYEDFTALGNKQDLLVVGAGGDATQTGDATQYLHTVDVQYENTAGLSFYAAYLGNYTNDQGPGTDFYNWGALAQAGYLINPKWEIFGRYDYTRLDGDLVTAGGNSHYDELTVGVNYYVHGQTAKFTVDLSYLPDGTPTAGGGLDYLATGDSEFVLRGQFQLLL